MSGSFGCVIQFRRISSIVVISEVCNLAYSASFYCLEEVAPFKMPDHALGLACQQNALHKLSLSD